MKAKLTTRERQIRDLMRAGKTRRKEIAAALGISTRTVDSFLFRIKLKDRAQPFKAA
jgi:DNA-binding NarL/FixJ family response regulator